MRDLYLLLWLYPKNKRIVQELKALAKNSMTQSAYLRLAFKSSNQKIKEIKDQLVKDGIKFLTAVDEKFPKKILNYEYSPLIISYIGNLNIYLDSKSVAMIGSRKIDPNLEQWVYSSFSNKNEKYVYVSGGAIGADQVVHKAALKSKNKTLLVLPAGLMNPYPKDIIKKFKNYENALYVSLFSPFQRIYKSNFYARNYLMAALSDEIVILQAKIKSGTMVTARYAIDMNKSIYALSCQPWDEKYSGNKSLLEDGANQIINLDLFQ